MHPCCQQIEGSLKNWASIVYSTLKNLNASNVNPDTLSFLQKSKIDFHSNIEKLINSLDKLEQQSRLPFFLDSFTSEKNLQVLHHLTHLAVWSWSYAPYKAQDESNSVNKSPRNVTTYSYGSRAPGSGSGKQQKKKKLLSFKKSKRRKKVEIDDMMDSFSLFAESISELWQSDFSEDGNYFLGVADAIEYLDSPQVNSVPALYNHIIATNSQTINATNPNSSSHFLHSRVLAVSTMKLVHTPKMTESSQIENFSYSMCEKAQITSFATGTSSEPKEAHIVKHSIQCTIIELLIFKLFRLLSSLASFKRIASKFHKMNSPSMLELLFYIPVTCSEILSNLDPSVEAHPKENLHSLILHSNICNTAVKALTSLFSIHKPFLHDIFTLSTQITASSVSAQQLSPAERKKDYLIVSFHTINIINFLIRKFSPLEKQKLLKFQILWKFLSILLMDSDYYPTLLRFWFKSQRSILYHDNEAEEFGSPNFLTPKNPEKTSLKSPRGNTTFDRIVPQHSPHFSFVFTQSSPETLVYAMKILSRSLWEAFTLIPLQPYVQFHRLVREIFQILSKPLTKTSPLSSKTHTIRLKSYHHTIKGKEIKTWLATTVKTAGFASEWVSEKSLERLCSLLKAFKLFLPAVDGSNTKDLWKVSYNPEVFTISESDVVPKIDLSSKSSKSRSSNDNRNRKSSSDFILNPEASNFSSSLDFLSPLNAGTCSISMEKSIFLAISTWAAIHVSTFSQATHNIEPIISWVIQWAHIHHV